MEYEYVPPPWTSELTELRGIAEAIKQNTEVIGRLLVVLEKIQQEVTRGRAD